MVVNVVPRTIMRTTQLVMTCVLMLSEHFTSYLIIFSSSTQDPIFVLDSNCPVGHCSHISVAVIYQKIYNMLNGMELSLSKKTHHILFRVSSYSSRPHAPHSLMLFQIIRCIRGHFRSFRPLPNSPRLVASNEPSAESIENPLLCILCKAE